MGKEYIEREAALNAAYKIGKKEYNLGNVSNTALVMVVEDYLRAIPAADVVERKKGKWMPSSLTWSYYNYDCSVCGCNEFRQVDHNGGYKAFNFCPNCGADMRGEDDA